VCATAAERLPNAHTHGGERAGDRERGNERERERGNERTLHSEHCRVQSHKQERVVCACVCALVSVCARANAVACRGRGGRLQQLGSKQSSSLGEADGGVYFRSAGVVSWISTLRLFPRRSRPPANHLYPLLSPRLVRSLASPTQPSAATTAKAAAATTTRSHCRRRWVSSLARRQICLEPPRPERSSKHNISLRRRRRRRRPASHCLRGLACVRARKGETALANDDDGDGQRRPPFE
jgi:hypothetical protein